jgi:hypothetical protein
MRRVRAGDRAHELPVAALGAGSPQAPGFFVQIELLEVRWRGAERAWLESLDRARFGGGFLRASFGHDSSERRTNTSIVEPL